jgi:hypothetical protein
MSKSTASIALGIFFVVALPARAQNELWVRQFGRSGLDHAYALAPAGSGGVFLAGDTTGSLGALNAGAVDAWLARYGGSGNLEWIRQLGTTELESCYAAASDGVDGVYVTGMAHGDLAGPNAGLGDAWVARYDSDGDQLWILQFGTSAEDIAVAAAPDGSNGVYLGGRTDGDLGGPNASGIADAWLARYDGFGNRLWIHQLGTYGDDFVNGAASDEAGGVFVCGGTGGDLGGWIGAYDAWIAHYDASGNQLFLRQVGTINWDDARSVASDGSGGLYVAGSTSGSFGAPNFGICDAWLARYDGSGQQAWVRQFGTNGWEYTNCAVQDGSSGVFVAGQTNGSLGATSSGDWDAWLARYDGSGNRLSLQQLGTVYAEIPAAASPDGSGGIYIGGSTNGDIGGSYTASYDAWFARYDSLPLQVESTFCTAGTTTNGCVPSISGLGTPSATFASAFTIVANEVEGVRPGLFLYGTDVHGFTPSPWGGSSSFMCLKAPTQRAGLQGSGGTPGNCDGTLSLDWNAFVLAHPGLLGVPFAPGDDVYAQAWFRDPSSPATTMLSDGLRFRMQP